MTTPEQHPDPITEGLAHGGQRLVQFIAIAAVGKQAHARRQLQIQQAQRRQDSEAARQAEQIRRATFEEARSRWAPAHDRRWLHQADLVQVARAWSAALPYSAVHEPAASAVRKCEERLRHLHPHGMSHYDRFRDAGLAPEDAMREAAPFFTRTPNVHTGRSAERSALPEGTGTRWTADEHAPDPHDWDDHRRRQQALNLIDDLQAQHLAHGLEDLRPKDLRTALENATNLPGRIITRAIEQHTASRPPTDAAHPPGPDHLQHFALTPESAPPPPSFAEATAPGSPARTPAQVAQDDFPYPIHEAIRLAAHQPTDQPIPSRPRHPAQGRHHRPGR